MNSSIVTVGNKNHNDLDNILTLSISNNDIYCGCVDYLFFKVLNLEPIEYFNLTNMEFLDPITDSEIDYYQKTYLLFKEKNHFSEKITSDLKELELYIREKALEENVIKESIIKNKYIESAYSYNSEYLFSKILKFYSEK